jgi:hypothetical protein
MPDFKCHSCNTRYVINDVEFETVYSNLEFFQCSTCGNYVLLKQNKQFSKRIENVKENKFKKYLCEIFDIEIIKYFFTFSWMKYKHPAARLFNKLATISELFSIYYVFRFIMFDLFKNESIEIFIESITSSMLLWLNLADVIIFRVVANFIEKYLKISDE